MSRSLAEQAQFQAEGRHRTFATLFTHCLRRHQLRLRWPAVQYRCFFFLPVPLSEGRSRAVRLLPRVHLAAQRHSARMQVWVARKSSLNLQGNANSTFPALVADVSVFAEFFEAVGMLGAHAYFTPEAGLRLFDFWSVPHVIRLRSLTQN